MILRTGAVDGVVGGVCRQLLRSADLFTVSQAAGALSECSIRNNSNKTLVSAADAIPLLVTMLQARPPAHRRCCSANPALSPTHLLSPPTTHTHTHNGQELRLFCARK